MTEGLFGYDRLSAITGIKVDTLYAMVNQGRIPYRRFSKRLVRFDPAEIEAWLKAKAVATKEATATEAGAGAFRRPAPSSVARRTPVRS